MDATNFSEASFKNELIKKLMNFRSKLPIFDLDVKVAGSYIYFKSVVCKIDQKLEIDYSLQEKTNVRRVKDILVDYFPVLYGYTEQEKSIEEILKGDITEDSILSKQYIKKLNFRVERRLDAYNELLCTDFSDKQLKLYRLNSPLVFFLRDCYSDINKASETFRDKAVYVKTLEQRNS